MASSGEKILIIELVATEAVISLREISNGNVPKPMQYLASLAVFAVLGIAAATGEKGAKFAEVVGGLVLLTILMNAQAQSVDPTKPVSPSNLGFIGIIESLITGHKIVTKEGGGYALSSIQTSATNVDQSTTVQTAIASDPTINAQGPATFQPAPNSVPSGSGQAEQVIQQAQSWDGTPYGQAAQAVKGVVADCSSFVQAVFKTVGVNLPRTTYQQVNVGVAVPSLADAQPGDLLFFQPPGETANSHVGIYLGNGQMIDAPTYGQTVGIHSIQGYGPITAIRRDLNSLSTGTLT